MTKQTINSSIDNLISWLETFIMKKMKTHYGIDAESNVSSAKYWIFFVIIVRKVLNSSFPNSILDSSY